MTHDKLTVRLRAADHYTNEAWPAMVLAANRLDRYRELLERTMLYLDADQEWQGEAALIVAIQEAIK